jgi:hypothetical protein
MANRSVEIHDSVLAGVSLLQGEARLHFSSVYIHQSEGVPGRDAGSVWIQEAVLRITTARMQGSFVEFPVDLCDGKIQIGNQILENEIPLPLRLNGPVALHLQAMGKEQTAVSFTGTGAELELLGEAKYIEPFRP